MASSRRFPGNSLIRRLERDSSSYDFFQAVRLLERAGRDVTPVGEGTDPDQESVRFRSHVGLEFPATDIRSLAGAGVSSGYLLTERLLTRLTREKILPETIANRLRVLEDRKFDGREEFLEQAENLLNARELDEIHQGRTTREILLRSAVTLRPPVMNVNFMGLAGAFGPLPAPYTEHLLERLREKDATLASFLDIFNHRLISLLYRSRKLYRPGFSMLPPEEEDISRLVFSLLGLGAPGPREGLKIPPQSLLRYPGLLANRSRSGHGLELILRDYFQIPLRLEYGLGSWHSLPPEEYSRIGSITGRNNLLGSRPATPEGASTGQAFLGCRIWDQESRFRIHLGPLKYRTFLDFLPLKAGNAFEALTELTRFYVGPEMEFSLRLRLDAASLPGLRLRNVRSEGPESFRLGWTSWLRGGEAAQGYRLTERALERLEAEWPRPEWILDRLLHLKNHPFLHEDELRDEIRAVLIYQKIPYIEDAFALCLSRERDDSGEDRFLLNEKSFQDLERELPDVREIFPRTDSLKDRHFSTKDEFLEALGEHLTKREILLYGPYFLNQARARRTGSMNSAYMLSWKAMRRLRLRIPGEVPDDILRAARPLQEERFSDQYALAAALWELLGAQNATAYTKHFQRRARSDAQGTYLNAKTFQQLKRSQIDLADHLSHRVFFSREDFLEALREALGDYTVRLHEHHLLECSRIPLEDLPRHGFTARSRAALRRDVQSPSAWRILRKRIDDLRYLEYGDQDEFFQALGDTWVYRLSQRCLDAAERLGVTKTVRRRLFLLQNRAFGTQGELFEVLKDALGDQEAERLRYVLLKHSAKNYRNILLKHARKNPEPPSVDLEVAGR